ncbi:MAG: Eco57I restriction-modification methylase domain-containing protein [Candidatus Hodarchaeales archaeon]
MSREKSMGQYFTPAFVVELMADLISEGSNRRKILEPSAGKGIFLDILSKRGYYNVRGIEIDADIANQSQYPIEIANFFDYPTSEKFDIVIGNPPYVRWKNLLPELKNYLFSASFWKKRMSGLTDYLQPFIFKSVDHLVHGGELIFISPLFWMQTFHAEPLRRFLLENGSLEIVINFHEARIFQKANLNLIIFKYRKNIQNNGIKIINYKFKRSLRPNVVETIRKLLQCSSSWELEPKEREDFEFFLVDQPRTSKPWRFIPDKLAKKIQKFEESCQFSPNINYQGQKIRFSKLFTAVDLKTSGYSPKNLKQVIFWGKKYLQPSTTTALPDYLDMRNETYSSIPPRYVRIGDITEIGNGMVSGLDKAFQLREELSLTKNEQELVISVVKAKNLNRYYVKDFNDYFFITPGKIPTEEALKKDYPSLFTQLEQFRPALEKRYQYNRKIPYWEWVFPRNYNLMQKAEFLICVPCKDRFDKRKHLRFALCNNGIFSTQDVTVLVKLEWVKESPEYVTAFLNSKEVFQWVKNKGFVRGGVAEFSEEPLKAIPFRLINWQSSTETKIHAKITQIVKEIRKNQIEDLSGFYEINGLISKLLNINSN